MIECGQEKLFSVLSVYFVEFIPIPSNAIILTAVRLSICLLWPQKNACYIIIKVWRRRKVHKPRYSTDSEFEKMCSNLKVIRFTDSLCTTMYTLYFRGIKTNFCCSKRDMRCSTFYCSVYVLHAYEITSVAKVAPVFLNSVSFLLSHKKRLLNESKSKIRTSQCCWRTITTAHFTYIDAKMWGG